MNIGVKRFLWGYLTTLAFSIVYFALVWHYTPNDQAYQAFELTLKTNLVLSFFFPIIFPFVSGILTAVVRPADFMGPQLSDSRMVSILAIVLVFLAALILWADSTQALQNRIVEPIEWADPDIRRDFFELDKCLRNAAAVEIKATCSGDDARTQYDERVQKHFKGEHLSLFKHMNAASIWQRVLSALSLVIGVTMLLTLVIYHLRGNPDKSIRDGLLAALGLTTFWIPIRLFSDWTIHYQSMPALAENSAVGIIGILLVVALLVAFLRSLGEPIDRKSVV